MVWYNANDGKSEREIILYDEEDIFNKDDIVQFQTCKFGDEGKYAKFTDGSNLYTKIWKVTNRLIFTEAGVFRRADIVHCCYPKRYIKSVYGFDLTEVHPMVRAFVPQEHSVANKIIAGRSDEVRMKLTPRIRMLTMEKFKARTENINPKTGKPLLGEEEIMDLVIENAKDTRSMHWKWSMTLLMAVHGMDVNQIVFSHLIKEPEEKGQQRITIFDDKRTITEPVLLKKRDFTKMLKSTEKQEAIVID